MKRYKPVLRVLAVIMAVVCLGVSLAPASFAFAGVLDPAAWLYPIWSMYGAQNGVNVTTTGDADFTIDGMTSLWNEYQSSRVSSGLQQAAQTITDFVNGVKGFVSVVAGAVTGGSLNTKLMLGAGIVSALDAFWNWIITDKLGGTSVDSTDFTSEAGNIYYTQGWPSSGHLDSFPVVFASNGYKVVGYTSSSPQREHKYIFGFDTANGIGFCILSPDGNFGVWWGPSFANSWALNATNTYNGLYYNSASGSWGSIVNVPHFSSLEAGLNAAYQSIVLNVGAGDLTVEPDAGVDVLGFPDSDEVDYVPSDAVIPWNIPYDSTKDTDDYIDAAFADAVSGDLTIGEEGEVVQPVPGVGPVGDYVAVGLGDVFPFCIPFDIYDFLSALAADPVAPSFTAELAFPEAVGGSQYVELDFDTPTFNQLASILRTMELLAFIVGLALLTRSMFIRG